MLLLLCMITMVNIAIAQTTISGKITDASDGKSLAGVSVKVRGTSTGVATDADGNFSIAAQPGSVLEVSYIGHTEQKHRRVKFQYGL